MVRDCLMVLVILFCLTACTADEDTGRIGQLAKIKDTEPPESPFAGRTDIFQPQTAETKKISYTYSGTTIPETFPRSLPVYTPAKPTSCRILKNNRGAIAVLLTQDPPAKIEKFYLEYFRKENWKIEDRMMMGNILSLLATRGTDTISISATEGNSGITLTLAISMNTR